MDKSRDDIAERCQARGGQFLANLAHIITDYRADVDRQWKNGSIRELAEAKNEKLAAEQRAVNAEKREAKYVAELKRLKVENEKMKEAMRSSSDELDKLRVQAVEDKNKIDSLGAEMLEVKGANETLEKTVVDLKSELQKRIEDVANGIGTGYQACYDRLKEAGVDLSGHGFDAYCSNLAKNLAEKNGESRNEG